MVPLKTINVYKVFDHLQQIQALIGNENDINVQLNFTLVVHYPY